MQNSTLPPVHRISTACEKLCVSRATIYRMAKAGTIKMIKVGKGSTRITDESLRQLLSARTAAPT
ncbi:helix-turn-helix domain-containing protein [Comamonas antarctica]|uniref:helix-turn-helix transcriptional regulator n=1 Tax=Comamonas antarctica TaxID=2743470 RepID=UPI0028E6C058|nr:helix-turn-helix domain-containing protein [Comamonas antarctica]